MRISRWVGSNRKRYKKCRETGLTVEESAQKWSRREEWTGYEVTNTTGGRDGGVTRLERDISDRFYGFGRLRRWGISDDDELNKKRGYLGLKGVNDG